MIKLNFKPVTVLFMMSFICYYSLGQAINTDKYCKKIQSDIDKFNGKKRYTTPVLRQINFTKIIQEEDTTLYMGIRTIGSTAATGSGVYILLENGEKITKNIETDVRVNTNAQFEHSAFFRLSKDEIELLKKYNITDTRLYIFDMKISKPIQYRAYIVCLDRFQ